MDTKLYYNRYIKINRNKTNSKLEEEKKTNSFSIMLKLKLK